MTTTTLPGLTVSVSEAPTEPTPLRTDVAGLLGRTRRGPILQRVRINGWRDYTDIFGGLADANTPYCTRGYFNNGGQVAHVVRLAGSGAAVASADMVVGELRHDVLTGAPSRADFTSTLLRIEATSPGTWANGTTVTVRYRSAGVGAGPEVDVDVEAPDEDAEHFVRVPPRSLDAALAASRLVRVIPAGHEIPDSAVNAMGPRSWVWRLSLEGGTDPQAGPTLTDYLTAVQLLQDEPEIALLAAPDLHDDLSGADSLDVFRSLLQTSADLHDRLVLIDVPPPSRQASSSASWTQQLRDTTDEALWRWGAVYHPQLVVNSDGPVPGLPLAVREVPASGHLAGVISRLDRERGAYYSPANASVYEAFDTAATFSAPEQAALVAAGLNLIRCAATGGIEVWGARTLDLDRSGRFVAHRRLVHRLVRGIRQVAEPLVFEGNGPEVQFALVRAITTLLLEAYNAGALQGDRPAQAFRVQCDQQNNPPETRSLGQLVCDIELAPAAPMEFIHIQLSMSPNGLLEVVEA